MTRLWNRRQTLWFVAGTAGSLVLHACTPPGQTPSTGEQAATIGLFTWIGSTPLHIAREKGFFEELGLTLEVKIFNANTDSNAAFIGDRLDATSPVTSEAVTLAAQGKDFRIVLVQDTSVGGDGILARNSVADLADFKGRRIAVEEGSVSHFFLLQALDTVGLGAGDFTLVNAPPDAAAAAYQAGQIDVAVTYAPYLAKANEAQPDGRIIFDSSQMPNAIADLYVFDTAYISDRPEAVEAFVRGVLRGLEFFNANRQEGLDIAARYLEVSPEELARDLEGIQLPDLEANLNLLANPDSDAYLLQSLVSMAAFLQEQGQIEQSPENLEKIVEPKFLEAIRAG